MIIVGKLDIMLRDMQMREGGLAGEISERSNYSLRNFLMLFVLRFFLVSAQLQLTRDPKH